MAAINFTPISLYYSTTASAAPSAGNLVDGELAINTLDEKLYFKNSTGTVKLLASSAGATGTVSSVAATVPAFLSISGSPITTSGTLAISYSGTALPVANGGTGQTTASAAFNALSPVTTTGDLIIGNGTNSATRLAIGSNGYVLTSNGTTATWVAGASGSVTSVAATVPAFLSVSGSPITSSGTLAISYSGTALPVANGGTGITSFGSGVATWLGTPSSANLASAVTDETGSGSLVFATSPTLVTPVLGTPASGTLSNCTVDGTYSVGFRKIPPVGVKTSSYTIAVADVGKYVEIGSGGSLVVPASTFSDGDAISVFNNTSGDITITCSAVTSYIAGTDATKTSVTLATRGVANILFKSASFCVITGNVS